MFIFTFNSEPLLPQNFGITLWFSYNPPRDGDRAATVGIFQSSVMCVEMLLFAVGHHFAFPHKQYPRVTELTMTSEAQRWLVEWGQFYSQERQLAMTNGSKYRARSSSWGGGGGQGYVAGAGGGGAGGGSGSTDELTMYLVQG